MLGQFFFFIHFYLIIIFSTKNYGTNLFYHRLEELLLLVRGIKKHTLSAEDVEE